MIASSPDFTPPPNLPEIIDRYLNNTSIQQIAADLRVHRVTIYRWMMNGHADNRYHDDVTNALIGRIAEADDALENAHDSCSIARAREMAKFARMDFERRRPKLYGPKQEIQQDTTVRVIIAPPPPLHIDTQPSIIEAKAQVVDNINGES
ncbi:MAG TPA: helix-turn-helix domain-containing protein [Allocoleopsis sp.]